MYKLVCKYGKLLERDDDVDEEFPILIVQVYLDENIVTEFTTYDNTFDVQKISENSFVACFTNNSNGESNIMLHYNKFEFSLSNFQDVGVSLSSKFTLNDTEKQQFMEELSSLAQYNFKSL